MRVSDIWLSGLAIGMFLLGLSLMDAALRAEGMKQELVSSRSMVGDLGLTDLALFTEARYTRHLSQADRFSPFQDHPMAFEHFPSGSLVVPPDY